MAKRQKYAELEQRIRALEPAVLQINALEDELRESREEFRVMGDCARDAIVMVDEEGKISYWNPAAEKIFGSAENEVTGKDLCEIIVPSRFREAHARGFQSFRQAGPSAGARRMLNSWAIRTDGGEFPVELTLSGIAHKGRWNAIAIVRDLTEQCSASEEIRRNYEIQNIVNKLLHISLENIPLEEMLEQTIDEVTRVGWIALESKGCILLSDNGTETLAMKAHRGFSPDLLKLCDRVPFGRCLCGRAAKSAEIVFADCVDELHDNRYEGIGGHGHYCVPIVTGERRILGVLTLYVKEGHHRDPKEEEFLTAVADTLAGIIMRRHSEQEVLDSLVKLRKAMAGTIQAIASAAETRDAYTAGHQQRVADLARSIASQMGLPRDTVDGIRVAGILHDIGKLAVPAAILNKSARLSDIEFALIKTHCEAGFEILKEVEFPWPVAQAVLQHHERMDGSGYPHGIKGDEILLEARILAVADVVEAMTSHRPYRPSLGIEKALDEITQNRGSHYDAEVVDACLTHFSGKGTAPAK